MAKKDSLGGARVAAAGLFKAKPKKKLAGPPEAPLPTPRLVEHYNTVVRPGMREKFGYKSDLSTPRITKVVLNMGIGDANENPKKLEALLEDLETITGQRPAVTRARISVANFKLREGMPVGAKVTLRRGRMYEFLVRLISLAIPRMRDFRGLSPKQFDGSGNYALGLADQLIFPEIKSDQVQFIHGMDIVVCTTARTDDEGRELLRLMGFPFRDLPVVLMGGEGA